MSTANAAHTRVRTPSADIAASPAVLSPSKAGPAFSSLGDHPVMADVRMEDEEHAVVRTVDKAKGTAPLFAPSSPTTVNSGSHHDGSVGGHSTPSTSLSPANSQVGFEADEPSKAKDALAHKAHDGKHFESKAQFGTIVVVEGPQDPQQLCDRAWQLQAQGQYVEAAQLYVDAACLGHAQSQRRLGFLYDEGLGVPQDFARAAILYEQAAAGGDVRALTNLGSLYEFGLGVSQSFMKALALYERAAAASDALAQLNLGNLHALGRGTPQRYDLAHDLYQRAAACGSGQAAFKLGLMYEDGLGVPKDYAQAAEYYQQAASHGDVRAVTNLACLYQHGLGVPLDARKAVELYTHAGDAGDAVAQYNVAQMYRRGEGVEESTELSRQWLEKAAAQGDARATQQLQLLATPSGLKGRAPRGLTALQVPKRSDVLPGAFTS